MKKRIVALLFALALLFSLTGCGLTDAIKDITGVSSEETEEENSEVVISVTPAPTAEPYVQPTATATPATQQVDEAYKSEVLGKAEYAFKTSGAEAACKILDEASSALASDPDYVFYSVRYRKSLPVYIDELTPTETSNNGLTKLYNITDCNGNQYTEHILANNGNLYQHLTQSNTYEADEYHNVLSGKVALAAADPTFYGTIRIYGNQHLLKEITVCYGTRYFTPEFVYLDISNYREITVEIEGMYAQACLIDFQLLYDPHSSADDADSSYTPSRGYNNL